jgi:hypothetical protein
MSHPSTPAPDHARYYQAVSREDERLAATLAAIRQDHDAGNLTIREAADARIAALQAHLARCQQLRREYLEGPEPPVSPPQQLTEDEVMQDQASGLYEEDEAAWLARIRAAHPDWSIRHVSDGSGWTAHRGQTRLWAGTLPDLERLVTGAEREEQPPRN